MAIYENRAGDPGSVELWAKVVPDSFRIMSIVSPRTGTAQIGLFFEVDEGEGKVSIWKARTPGVGGKLFVLAEAYEASAYKRKRRQEKEGSADNVETDSAIEEI